jgi:hypothetical protein
MLNTREGFGIFLLISHFINNNIQAQDIIEYDSAYAQ